MNLQITIDPSSLYNEDDLKDVEFFISILIDLINKKKKQFEKEKEDRNQVIKIRTRKPYQKKTVPIIDNS
jgi:hypothetical protein